MLLSLAGFTGMALLVKFLGVERGVSPWLALFFRAATGMVVLQLGFSPGGRADFRRALTRPMMIGRGVLGAVGTACFYLTLPELGAGKATLIGNTWVIWGALMAVVILREPLNLRKGLGMMVAVAGVVLLMGLHARSLLDLGRYEVVAVVGALLAGGVVVVIRQLTRTDNSGTIFASQCAYTGLLTLPFLLGLPVPGWVDLGLLLLAGLLASVGQIGMTEGFRHLPVSTGGAFQILLPVCITLASVAIFGETFTLGQGCGAALILLGCHQTVFSGAPASKSRSPAEGS
jgi:drug/metabolite transporter (DMT)-like permease